jgi:hypothetical protein
MKKFSDTIGNRTHDLLVCSAVPQPTAPPRAPISEGVRFIVRSVAPFNKHENCLIHFLINIKDVNVLDGCVLRLCLSFT